MYVNIFSLEDQNYKDLFTIAPNITLMGEFPIMYTFQSHPFNWHL